MLLESGGWSRFSDDRIDSSLKRKNGLRIASLTADYLGVAAEVHCWAECIESPAVWRKDGYYYVFGSHLTGWDCNDNVCMRVDFEDWTNTAPS